MRTGRRWRRQARPAESFRRACCSPGCRSYVTTPAIARNCRAPNPTNGYRLTVRGITPKHGTEYLLGRSGTLIAIKGVISNPDSLENPLTAP